MWQDGFVAALRDPTRPPAITDDTRRYAALAESLAAHFVAHYGAPDRRSALPAAEAELAFMAELCAGHADDTLLSVQRELTDAGVRERFRVIGG